MIGEVFTLQVLWEYQSIGQVAQNNIHFRQDSELILDTPAEDLCAAFVEVAAPAFQSCISENYALTGLVVKNRPDGLTVFETTVADISGTRTGDQLPSQNSLVLNYKTAHPGRTGRGRLFLPPTGEDVNTGAGLPSAGLIANGIAAGDALRAMASGGLVFANWTWGLWSESDQMFYPTVSHKIKSNWGSQKGRRQ